MNLHRLAVVQPMVNSREAIRTSAQTVSLACVRAMSPNTPGKKVHSLRKILSDFGKGPIGSGARVMGNRQERKHRRFHLKCPVCVTFQAAGSVSEVDTMSENVSLGGLLVKSAAMIPEHTPVTFIINVQGEQAVHPICLVGEGKIVRVESSQDDAIFVIAVECSVPIKQLGDYLPSA